MKPLAPFFTFSLAPSFNSSSWQDINFLSTDVTKTGNEEWGIGNGEWRMGNGEWGMGNGKLKWEIENKKLLIFLH